MRRCYKIYIMRTFSLKLTENIRKARDRNIFAYAVTAYTFILAITAAQIAAGKENRSASVLSAYTWLLPVMESGAGNSYFRTAAAISDFSYLLTLHILGPGYSFSKYPYNHQKGQT